MRNKIVVVTGASRGYGYAIAEAMLRAGATVVISGRSAVRLKRAVKTLQKLGPVTAVECDVRREQQVYALARKVVRQHGRIDVWVNNAGYSAAAGMMLDVSPKKAVDMFLTNDLGALYGTRAALHFMFQRHQGTLVNIYGNGSFLRPASPTGLYGATKAWLTSFTRSLAKEIRGSGVCLIGFSPGMLLTDMLTSPKIAGARGREMLKNYGFVLRMLAGSPERAAERLVAAVQSNRRAFVEHRLFKPWTPFLGLLRVAWENITHSGRRPEFKLKLEPAYRPKIQGAGLL